MDGLDLFSGRRFPLGGVIWPIEAKPWRWACKQLQMPNTPNPGTWAPGHQKYSLRTTKTEMTLVEFWAQLDRLDLASQPLARRKTGMNRAIRDRVHSRSESPGVRDFDADDISDALPCQCRPLVLAGLASDPLVIACPLSHGCFCWSTVQHPSSRPARSRLLISVWSRRHA